MTNEELDAAGKPKEIARYDLEQPTSHMGIATMQRDDACGDWVRYDDHTDAITALRAECDAAVMRADNHEETLRGIQKWLADGDHTRAAQWASDGLAGYNDTAENTLCEAMARAEAALRAIAEGK